MKFPEVLPLKLGTVSIAKHTSKMEIILRKREVWCSLSSVAEDFQVFAKRRSVVSQENYISIIRILQKARDILAPGTADALLACLLSSLELSKMDS